MSRISFAITTTFLDKVTEGQGLNGGDLPVPPWCRQEVPLLGGLGLALEVHPLAPLTHGLLRRLVRLHPLEDLLLARGLADVLDPDVDALLEDPPIDELVDADADGRLRHVEHD